MSEKSYGGEFFHVTRVLDYNSNPPFKVGNKIQVGIDHNPYFGYYEKKITIPINDNNKIIQVPAIKFLTSVRDKTINSPEHPKIAHQIADHYLMLARELIMEEVRKEIEPDAPSRKCCLWVVEKLDDAKYWVSRLGGEDVRIARLSLDGVIHHADASHLLGDSEPLTTTYKRARAYWEGKMSDKPEPEVVFSGTATVLAFEN